MPKTRARYQHLVPLALAAALVAGCHEQAPRTKTQPERVTQATASQVEPAPKPGLVARLDLVAMREAGAMEGLEVIEATLEEDPAFGKVTKRFRGWRLRDVLAKMPELKTVDPAQHEVQMRALDGYTVTAAVATLTTGEGLVAFEDDSGKGWGTFIQGKRELTPEPFYLVWTDRPYGPDKPWPYQLAEIRLVDLKLAYGRAHPGAQALAQADVAAGWQIYKGRCMSCHSINLSGGTLGPELNVPRNITAYWSEEHLRGFIANPANYRSRSVMPSFKDLSTAQVGQILAYLRAMARRQACTSAESCEALLAAAPQ